MRAIYLYAKLKFKGTEQNKKKQTTTHHSSGAPNFCPILT